MSVIFFQSTTLGGNSNSAGLFDLLLTHINGITEINVFDEILVIAPDYTMVDYLFDKITLRNGICANIKFEILFGPFLNNIYMIIRVEELAIIEKNDDILIHYTAMNY